MQIESQSNQRFRLFGCLESCQKPKIGVGGIRFLANFGDSELWDISDTFHSNIGIDLGNLAGTFIAGPVLS
jgi:hypothetical protein